MARSALRFRRTADGWTSSLSQVCLFLRPEGATWTWPDGLAVTLRFRGAQPTARLEPIVAVPDREHRRPRRRRPVAERRCDAARYTALWPGIDLLFRAEGPALKYEFRVATGADPSQIQLEWEGVERLALDADGNMLLQGPDWMLIDLAPLAWQPVAVQLAAPETVGELSAIEPASEEGRLVAAAYRLEEGGSFGFSLDAYDGGRPLVIDPELQRNPT
jgi:hypothetical protein